MSDRKAELERKKAKLQAMREEKKRKDEERRRAAQVSHPELIQNSCRHNKLAAVYLENLITMLRTDCN